MKYKVPQNKYTKYKFKVFMKNTKLYWNKRTSKEGSVLYSWIEFYKIKKNLIHLQIDSSNNHMTWQLICLHMEVIYECKGTRIAKIFII